MVATAEGSTAAEVAVCNTIQQGDTAAMVSWRMTGSQQEYQPWFQILDAQSRVVPKSQVPRDSCGMAGVYSLVAARRRVEPGATVDNGK